MSGKQLVKRLKKTVYVGLVIVNVRADAQAAKPRSNVNPLSRKATHNLLRHAVAKAKADNVGRPEACLRHRKAFAAQTMREPRRQRCKPRGNLRSAPFRHELHSDRGHLHRDEMIALAHVEAPRIAHISGVGEIGVLFGAHSAAAVAGLLKRNAGLMAFGDLKESAPIGAEQPFVGREHDEIRIERAYVQANHPGALRGVNQKDSAAGAGCGCHNAEVDDAAVAPVHR
jgi:hypothetical protein